VAVENARENVEKNDVSDIVKIRKGSIGDLHKKFNVIVANIDLKGLRRMRKSLLHHLKVQGFLILSGILEGEKDRLLQNFMETGLLQWEEEAQEGEWICLTLKRKKRS
jgi:ribosomal protein L11 methyltransferase